MIKTTSVEELQRQVEYWKIEAGKYKTNYEACHDELEEFQKSSRDLEGELERQLEGLEKKCRDLQLGNQAQQMEIDSLKEKYQNLHSESFQQIQRLEFDLTATVAERDEARQYIRELEQMNDDLERAKRSLVTSLEDFEKRMNEAIERNAFLESEVEEKDCLLESVQRLREETRDLKQELNAREKLEKERQKRLSQVSNGSLSRDQSARISTDYHQRSIPRSQTVDVSTISATSGSLGTSQQPTGANGPIAPSTRISALNIVNDLLRKIGAIELKLASCKKFVVGENGTIPPADPTQQQSSKTAGGCSIDKQHANHQ